MSKDPAILFYTQDFITGTMFFSFEQKGKYITLLCAQHQQGGLIDKNIFNSIVGEDTLLRDKFIESEDGFFNQRMMIEVEKRSVKSTNLSANAKIRWEKEKQKQCKSNAKASTLDMPIEDEDEDENENEIEDIIDRKESEYYLSICNTFLPAELIQDWKSYLDYCYERGDIRLNRSTITAQAKFLRDHVKDAKQIINNSIQNNWKGLFELKQEKSESQKETTLTLRS